MLPNPSVGTTQKRKRACTVIDRELEPGPTRSFAMQSRAAEYRMHAVVCAAQATAAPDPMKQFYQALELQWVCLAQRAEREAVTSQQDEIAAASQTSKAA